MSERVVISCELGSIEVDIFTDRAPLTCENFFTYLEQGLFRQTSFYRIVTKDNQPQAQTKIEVVQGGLKFDPEKGYEPGKCLGPIEHESTDQSGINHLDGTISMGRFAPGETYGSFFFCIGDQPELDFGGGRFTDGYGASAFGTVVNGRGVLQKVFERAEDTEFLQDEVKITSLLRCK